MPESKPTETKAPAFVPKVKKNLTLPLIKPAIDKPIYIKFNEPMKIGKKVDDKKDAAIITTVTDLESGEIKQYLVPSVFRGILRDEYGAPVYGTKGKDQPMQELEPADDKAPHSYVGKGFAVTKHAKASGKSYNPMTIQELEL